MEALQAAPQQEAARPDSDSPNPAVFLALLAQNQDLRKGRHGAAGPGGACASSRGIANNITAAFNIVTRFHSQSPALSLT